LSFFSALILKEKVSFKHGVGLFISLIGVLLVLTDGNVQQIFRTAYNQGDLLMLLAILVWTFYSILGKRLQRIPPISATAVSVLFALILLFPFVLTSGFNFSLSKEAIIGMLYIGIFPSVGSFVFWNLSIRQIGPSKAGIYLNLITVFTAIISIALGDSITFVQIVGGLFVFIGVYLTSRKANKVHVRKAQGM
jgi:drug/metabolite transporter (DMT)-like permease